ncbi:MAG: hypothetical protein DHS20C17_16620 [Cyclobacteriaceae bacterium]|nr:MAG: hypothetical protein DHS20C17_16620 [Cyclobacteriaceae bacterium]
MDNLANHGSGDGRYKRAASENYLTTTNLTIKKMAWTAIFIMLFIQTNSVFGQGLTIENEGTKLAYVAHNGKPLFAFGVQLEYMMVFPHENYDYPVWSEWAEKHGMNFCRTRVIQPIITNAYLPYKSVGEGKYDLTQFDPDFWQRFRNACVNLQQHGVIMHLLVFPHNMHVRVNNWGGSAFNPANNVNPEATAHLEGDYHYKFWNSLSDNKALWQIQKASMEKIVEATADLDNIIYDISHEFRSDCCGSEKTDWTKARKFFNAMADVIVDKYYQLEPNKKPIIGLDAEHFHKFEGQEDWNFSNPKFQLMIKGNSVESRVPTSDEVKAYREKYKKPFIIEEGSADDDEGEKIKFISIYDTDRTVIRKFVWKWMMNRTQMVDIYGPNYNSKAPDEKAIIDYDPNGQNAFEDDALILRSFWDNLRDYPNLDVQGRIASGPGFRKMVLSSSKEAIAYMASKMGEIGTKYQSSTMDLSELALKDGVYTVEIWKPIATGGKTKVLDQEVRNGALTLNLPHFTDDLAVHIYAK